MSEPATAETPSSVHTNTFPALLNDLGITLAVSTYQSGSVILVRAAGGELNTHFRDFNLPMGLAAERGRLAVATKASVWEFHDQTPAAARVDPSGKTDTVYLPRFQVVTGFIAIHEIAFSGDELWAVNTLFSCLCTFDRFHSFVPRWRPPFITALSPTDRCHLNGFALVDGTPRYATALGTTDEDRGWRPNKARGGVLMEVPSGRMVLEGLSMPHSPRVYDGSLWVLESGSGSLERIDPVTGQRTVVALLPGFTRGLDFYGPYAFVGLSQVRETAVFSGIPITERLPVEERMCGVWVVDIRTGQIVAFLRFDTRVQEVFAVTVLQGCRWPDLLTDPADPIAASSYVLSGPVLGDVVIPPPSADASPPA